MKEYLKNVGVQATAILIAAGGAALITFLTSLAQQTGICPGEEISIENGAILGGILKALHGGIYAIMHSQHT